MPASRSRVLLTALWLALVPAAASGQAVVTGRVVDAGAETPIAGAEVRILEREGGVVARVLTADEGGFRMQLDRGGVYALEVRRVGYAFVRADSILLAPDDETEIEVRLGIDAVPLDPVVVVAPGVYEPSWITDFRERAETNQRAGLGRIYTREDVERLRPLRAVHLISTTQWRGGCQPEILLDGLPADASLSMIRGDELEGVEIYRGFAQIPPEYYRTGMCGLVMFWRRADAPDMGPLTWKRVGVASAVLLLLGAASLAF